MATGKIILHSNKDVTYQQCQECLYYFSKSYL